jgi:ABC-type Mn2+/Zn2+ transport system ATPase subunit
VVQVQNLSVLRDGLLAVDGVSFSLAPETDTALVGPNGAGTSTLVAAPLGLLPSSGGSVRIPAPETRTCRRASPLDSPIDRLPPPDPGLAGPFPPDGE